jgi:crossover junction endodeoxyribonuclease RuvC
MRILGIDPGLATVGIGIIESESAHDVRPIDWLTIQTKAGLDTPMRLLEIRQDLIHLLEQYKPELAVIERLYFETNVKTAIDVAQARGVLLMTLQEHGVPIIEATPLQLKSAITGDGKADKSQMQEMIRRLLQLTEIPKPDDAADALGLAIYGAVHYQYIES